MASSSSSNSWILSVKLLLITFAVVSVAVTVKLAVPLILTGLPAVWSVVVTWLKPPYLYVVINGIIITIAASTRFQHNHHRENQSEPEVRYGTPDVNAPPSPDLRSDVPPVEIPTSFGVMERSPVSYGGDTSGAVEPPVVDMDMETVAVVGGDEDEFVTSRSTWNSSERRNNSPPAMKLIQPEFNFPVKEKRLVASRFNHNRKPAKPSPEGARALRVLKPKKHETLETTWKMITDGRQLPLTRHLRKSDTFNNLHHHQPPSSESSPATKPKAVRKSETFNDRTTYANQNDYPQPPSPAPAPVGKLKKDGSLSQDELNRRVEAFIKKFNDDMRLQRQESLKHYMEMVKSGAR